MTTFILRLIKIVMVASFALWLSFITTVNITQPELNQIEIDQTISMSTLPETVNATDREISSEQTGKEIFTFIITLQAIAAACLALGALNLLIFSFKPQSDFHRAKWLAALGFGVAFLFFFVCLSAFASEYFLAYRSVKIQISNLEFQGLYHTTLLIVALAFLIQPESMPITIRKNSAAASKASAKPTPKPNNQ